MRGVKGVGKYNYLKDYNLTEYEDLFSIYVHCMYVYIGDDTRFRVVSDIYQSVQ